MKRTHVSVTERPKRRTAVRAGPRTQITFEGTIFSWFSALFSLAALLLGENLVLLMGCTAFCCGQAARLFARRNLLGLQVARGLPRRGRVGTAVPVTYELSGDAGRAAVGVEVEDRVGHGARPVTQQIAFAGLERGATVRASAELAFVRRGRHVLGDLSLRSRYPLGLFMASQQVPATSQILVRPREGRPTAALRSWLGGSSRAQVRPSLTARGDDVFHGVREFREGDDPRRIHWRTTARSQTLAVTEWRREQGRDLVVLLGRAHGAGYGTLRTFESTVSAVATIWRAAHAAGVSASLELGSAHEGVRGGPQRLGPGLDALAGVSAQGGRRPRAALRRLGAARRSRIVVYVASGPEPGIKKRLQRAAGRGGSWLLIRADGPGLSRWVRGL